jgi:hypothetical protein
MTDIAPGAAKKVDAHLWERDPDDYYVEEEWCARRLFAVEKFEGTIVDPFCGSGRIVRAAIDAGYDARGYDARARSDYVLVVQDFGSDQWWPSHRPVHNIVGNPPFDRCGWKVQHEFIRLALERAERKAAFILPANFDCAEKNATFLEQAPYRKKLILTPRPSMPPGRVIEAGGEAGGGKKDFAWYIFLKGYDGKPEAGWLRRNA